MIPPKIDSRWRAAVMSTREIPFKGLVPKLLLVRVRLMTKHDPSPANVQQAIHLVHEYFAKNEITAKDDLKLLLG